MYGIEIPNGINNLLSLFYYLGLWHRGDKATVRETRIKSFYIFYYLLFPISFIVGAIQSTTKDESIFLLEVAIVSSVLFMKLCYLIWSKEEILKMLTRIGVYSIESREEFNVANEKLKKFMKFVVVLMLCTLAVGYTTVILPIFGKEKQLFYNIGFPLDWKNNDVAFWMANAFIFTEITITMIAALFSVIIWLLMMNCALRYEILGMHIRNMGVRPTNETTNKRKMSDKENHNLFRQHFIAAIDAHQHIKTLTQDMESFFAKLFFTEIVTSGLCICASIYCLAFNVGENFAERFIHLASLVYHISEIFMIMYLGNEIKLSSGRVSYCLFESNWVDQPQSTKKLIIIFGELVMQPHELVIGYLYPLNLETFRRILNFAYNSFNILKNLAE